jgi:CubicO group peptidase (beta-lactamase class C family)
MIDREIPTWKPGVSMAPTYEPKFDLARVKGMCADEFQPVWDALLYNLQSGEDIGASVAVFIDGEPVVDIFGGYFDATFERPWGRNTIITTHSMTKTMTAMAALVLADSGELDLDERVCTYWPEFAKAGKRDVLVRHLLGHTSGLAGWTEDVSWDDVYDLDYSSALLAAQEPWWEPGTAAGYHGMTQGHLVNGVIQRITGMTLGQYFAQHVAGPLGADYHIGTGPEHDHRVATFIQAVPEDIPHGNWIQERVGLNPNLTPLTSHSLAWRRAEVGGANGHGNARAVATIHSTLACGEANGVRLLSDRGRRRALEPQSDGVDLLLGIPTRWGMGFNLECVIVPNPMGHELAFWGGNGGSLGLVDFTERMSVSFVMNRWLEGPYETLRFNRILKAVYESLAARSTRAPLVASAAG